MISISNHYLINHLIFLDLSPDRDWVYFASKEKAIESFSSNYNVFCISEFNLSESQVIELVTCSVYQNPIIKININIRWYYKFDNQTKKFDFVKSKQFGS